METEKEIRDFASHVGVSIARINVIGEAGENKYMAGLESSWGFEPLSEAIPGDLMMAWLVGYAKRKYLSS